MIKCPFLFLSVTIVMVLAASFYCIVSKRPKKRWDGEYSPLLRSGSLYDNEDKVLSRKTAIGGDLGIKVDAQTIRAGHPLIDWVPNETEHLKRVARLASERYKRPQHLPSGYPSSINTRRTWTPSDFKKKTTYILRFTRSDIEEIENAVTQFEALQRDRLPDELSADTFPLPTLGSRLRKISQELHFGQGFYILRGLEPKNYSPRQNLLIYLGLTSYIAPKRGLQERWGNYAIHITDVGDNVAPQRKRQSPYSNLPQPFHNDVCDILAMYILERAKEGGASEIASTGTVFNKIASSRPDIVHTLTESKWVFDLHADEDEPLKYYTRPILFNGKHGPFFFFSRRMLTGSAYSPRSPGVPPMTEYQAEALDAVHFAARDVCLSLQLERGDIELLNNYAVFHARRGFRDDKGPGGQKRHAVRLWLRNEELAWETPGDLATDWRNVYGEDSPWKENAAWRLEPPTEEAHVSDVKDTCIHG